MKSLLSVFFIIISSSIIYGAKWDTGVYTTSGSNPSKSSFIRKLTPKKLHHYARLSESLNDGEVKALSNSGLLKKHHSIVLDYKDSGNNTHAVLIQKWSNQN
jgi:hypothetical protein